MDEIRVTVHHRDSSARWGEIAPLGPLSLPMLHVGPGWASAMLPLTFEEAVERLSKLPRLHIEPDGSFVWAGEQPSFHFEGQLHDRGKRLSHVEINGYGSTAPWLTLIEAAAGDLRNLMIQLVRDGRFFAATAADKNHENTK